MKISSLSLMKLIILLIFIGYSMQVQAQYQIVAHRGASHLAPENTVVAAELAWKLGADAVEVDIYLSQDGYLMVNHDKDTKRTAGHQYVIKNTEAAQLRKLEVGGWKDSRYQGEKMPYLHEIISTVPAEKKLFIEVKSGPEILTALQEAIRQSGKAGQMIVISFDKGVVVEGKRMMPEIPFYWLRGNFDESTLEEVIAIAKENKLDGLDLNYQLISPELMRRMQQEGLEVYAYTVNDAKVAQNLVSLKVAGITTDRPGWLKEQLQ